MAQSLCPPAFLNADDGNTEVYLSWTAPDTADYGDILFAECFENCDSAAVAFDIIHGVDNGSGGWFRDRYGDPLNCGDGMFTCADGGTDDFSAIAYFSGQGANPIDSRMITGEINLTSYTTATLEFIDAYAYPGDAHDSNMVEISTDNGTTWNIIAVSNPTYDIVHNAIDISAYAGSVIKVAFRYLDTVGYGEEWFVDNIRLWGGTGGRNQTLNRKTVIGKTMALGKKSNNATLLTEFYSVPYFVKEGSERSYCGTFQNYNIYQNGVLAASTPETEYTVTGLTNFAEYCFDIRAAYAEGESEASVPACAMPLDPFIVSPGELSVAVGEGEYRETSILIANHDTTVFDFSVFSMEIANLEVAAELLTADFDLGLWGDMYDANLLWAIGDSSVASSTYLDYPENGTMFAFYCDDDAGDGAPAVDLYLATEPVLLSGSEKVYLMLDMFFPQSGGYCGSDLYSGGIYADHSEIVVSTDGGATWVYVDSNYVNGNGWTKLLYNLTPYTQGAQLLQVAVRYNDCGGNWAYGIGVDNVAIKQGDDYSWLTVSPYGGKIAVGDSIDLNVGVYGIFDGFSATETMVFNAGPYENNIILNMSVGESGTIPAAVLPEKFALHQNFPNPFNPVTEIRFDIPQASFARVDIYNVLGQKVKTLYHGLAEPGYHYVQWDGKNETGETVPTGMYFYKLHAGSFTAVEKLLFLK